MRHCFSKDCSVSFKRMQTSFACHYIHAKLEHRNRINLKKRMVFSKQDEKIKCKNIIYQNGCGTICYNMKHKQILSMIARGPDGVPGLERLTGERVDITEWLNFTMWNRVWIINEPDGSSPPQLARNLSASHQVGSIFCYFLIKANVQIESRTTVQHVTEDDMNTHSIKEQIIAYDESLKKK